MNRRSFLLASGMAAAPLRARDLKSPNDTVRVACVGIQGKIIDHVGPYLGIKNVEIAALCDIDDAVMARRLKDIEAAGRKRPDTYKDIRKLLEDKSIDAVSIATPNHSHTLLAHLGLPGGQGCLRRKTVRAQYVRGPADCRGGGRTTGAWSSMAPTSAPNRPCARPSSSCATAWWANSTWPACSASSGATPLARAAGGAGSCGRGLRPLDRTGPEAPVHPQPLPLQLPLVLGIRQRRSGQPGHAPGGRGPLGARRHLPDQGQRHRRPLYVR